MAGNRAQVPRDRPPLGDGPGVIARLSTAKPELREVERRIGDYLYQHQRSVIHLSVTELADATATSEASVIRLAQKLGYPGFSALKIALALELQDTAPAALGELDESDDLVTVKRKVIEASIGGLRDTIDLLDDGALSEAVGALERAPRIEAYGLGTSAPMAEAARALLIQIGLPVVTVTDSHLQALSAVQLRPGDVVLAISESGSNVDIVEAVEAARQAGATCIALTRHALSPLTKVAHIVLLAAARPRALGGFEWDDRVSQLAVLDTLAVALAHRRKKESREALARGREILSRRRRF